MFSFDFNSTVERKNPEGVIEACRVLARGGTSILPPSRDWDRRFLTPLLAQDP